ncbi:AAA family ATPase [Kitasatospora sp. NPDC036755]|uniref:helix-turn-helix transcriptional regulator n=1 Tax=Kitasatospora sp. NPDC036755 TaxID=3154600 RepID=UPI0033D50F34
MRLVERDEEIRILDGLLGECARGFGRVAVVRGAVASGKTELLSVFAARAAESGAQVVGARASRAEQELPFGVIGQLVPDADACPDGELSRLLEEGRTAVWGQPEDSRRALAPTLYGISRAVIDLAGPGPLVIVVDDVQYADPASLQCLAYVVRRITAAPVMLVLGECTSVRSAHPELHLELIHQPHCRRLPLRPLSPAGTAAMLRAHLRGEATEELVAGVHAAGGGNPLMTKSVIDDVQESGGREVVAGEAYARAVMATLYRSEPSTLRYAQALAVLGGGSATVQAQLAGLSQSVAQHADQRLRMIGLTDERGIRHPRAVQAVTDSMDLGQLREMHERAAYLLYLEGASAGEVAVHLVAGPGNPPWAVRVLRDAGHEAFRKGDTATAVRFLRAAQTAAAGTEDIRIRADLARIEWHRDPLGVTRHLDTLAAAGGDGRLDPPAALALVEYLLWHGQLERATALVEQLAGTTVRTDPQTAARFRATCLWLAGLCPRHAARLQHLVGNPPAAVPSARPIGRPQDATALLIALRHDRLTGENLAAAEETLQQTRISDESLAGTVTALTTLVLGNRLEKAETWCRRLAALADERESPTWLAVLTSITAELAYRRGDLATAEAEAQRGLQLLSPEAWGVAIGFPLAALLSTATAAGKPELAAHHLATPLPAAVFETLPGLLFLRARGRHYLATRRYRSALNDFRTCQQLVTDWNIDAPGVLPWRTDCAQAYLRIGDQQRALSLVNEQLQLLQEAQPQHQRVRGSALRVLAAASDVKKRPQLLEEAVQVLEQCGDQLELAHAYADLGTALHALGEPHEARNRLRSAQFIAKQCSAVGLLRTLTPQSRSAVRPAGAEQRAAEAQPEGVPSAKPRTNELSSAEQRVAALAAQGHTNREIAGKLFLTVSTVEQHLTRVYRKLNVAGRSSLSADLAVGA